jgi:hypothetical protein
MTRKTHNEIGDLTPEQIKQLNQLAAKPDTEIDFSDIPELTEIPAGAVRGKDWKRYRGNTIVLSDEVHAYFAAIAGRRGVSLNALINDVLAREMALAEVLK